MSAVAGIEPDIALLAARDHHEPHRVLGAHPADGGVALRVWRPGATAVRVIPDGGAPIELEHRASGLFEAVVAGSRNLPRYEVEVELGGLATRGRDPYSFLPTSASSTCTWWARAATRSCGSASARTRARSTAPPAWPSRSGPPRPAR